MSTKGKICTIGNFDGVHRGHRHMLEQLAQSGRTYSLEPHVITFTEHPLRKIAPEKTPARISSAGMRRRIISGLGFTVDEMDFDQVRRLTAAEFLQMLRSHGYRRMTMGFNNRIGSDRKSYADLADNGILAIDLIPTLPSISDISSSAIREAITGGNLDKATEMLGHWFGISGTVVHGNALGRTIGFPTANILPDDPRQLLPKPGAYAVAVEIGGEIRFGMANAGNRPTIGGTGKTLEVNLFGDIGDIYGQPVTVYFLSWLRAEKKFPSLEALKKQLDADREEALDAAEKYRDLPLVRMV